MFFIMCDVNPSKDEPTGFQSVKHWASTRSAQKRLSIFNKTTSGISYKLDAGDFLIGS